MVHSSALPSKNEDIQAFLQQSLVFRGLGPADLFPLVTSMTTRSFFKGETIFSPFEPCTSLLLVDDGLVKVSVCSPSGKQITYLLAERGEPLNLVGPFTGLPRLLGATALTETRVASVPQDPFLAFVYDHPKVIHNILRILGQAIDSANSRIIDMFEKPVELRLMKVLHTLHRKFGNPIPFTSLELAELAGTTTESALRAMGRLRRAGVIRSGRGEVCILDAPQLERQCEEILWV